MDALEFSVLDLVPVPQGSTAAQAIEQSVDIAQWADKAGLVRHLVAEHHNTARLASAASAIVIQRLLDRTQRIQVGAGGVMLPNHSPLQVAETYATLDALYPGRVDLGIGRAPGTDPLTASLITRRNYVSNQEFYDDIMQICGYFDIEPKRSAVRAYPGAGAKVHPIILGSTSHSAYVAGAAGLPYAFAAHFSSEPATEAADIYRRQFKPSKYLEQPYLIISLWNFASDTAEEAERRYESMLTHMMAMLKGKTETDSAVEPPPLTSGEKILMTARYGGVLKGSAEDIQEQWKTWNSKLAPDELMLASFQGSSADVIHSLEIVCRALG